MKILGSIKPIDIRNGTRRSQRACPLNLSLSRKKHLSNVIVTSKAVCLKHDKYGYDLFLGPLPPKLVEWIHKYDDGQPVEPIHYTLEIE